MPFAYIVDSEGNIIHIIGETDDDSVAGAQQLLATINLLYGWNGVTWERVNTDGSGNLKITL